MAEAWHQHLQNLTWLEQIDRFFNPSKYSCTTATMGDGVWYILLISIVACTVCALILHLWLRRMEKSKVV